MTTTAYNLVTSTDEYVSILSDIVTLAERGVDGSDEVDKASSNALFFMIKANYSMPYF